MFLPCPFILPHDTHDDDHCRQCSVLNIDKYGKTPVHLAVAANQMEMLAFLLERVTAWAFHVPSKMTLVQTAAKAGNLPAVKMLLAHGFLATETTGEGETALHLASKYGHLAVAKALVRAGGVLHAATHTAGHTPLHFACLAGHTDVATFLVRCGADAHVPDKTPGRKTPVDKCEDSNHRVTLNAVLLASLQFRSAVEEQEVAEVRLHEAMHTKMDLLAAKRRGLHKDLAFLCAREGLLVAKHRSVSDAVAVVEASRRRANSPPAGHRRNAGGSRTMTPVGTADGSISTRSSTSRETGRAGGTPSPASAGAALAGALSGSGRGRLSTRARLPASPASAQALGQPLRPALSPVARQHTDACADARGARAPREGGDGERLLHLPALAGASTSSASAESPGARRAARQQPPVSQSDQSEAASSFRSSLSARSSLGCVSASPETRAL